MLTGESWPRSKAPGRHGARRVDQSRKSADRARDGGRRGTRLAALARLVERAASERPRMALLADRVAGWFVAALLGVAAATGLLWWQIDPSRALAVTFAVLVVCCPCALSLATPAALAAAAGALGAAAFWSCAAMRWRRWRASPTWCSTRPAR